MQHQKAQSDAVAVQLRGKLEEANAQLEAVQSQLAAVEAKMVKVQTLLTLLSTDADNVYTCQVNFEQLQASQYTS